MAKVVAKVFFLLACIVFGWMLISSIPVLNAQQAIVPANQGGLSYALCMLIAYGGIALDAVLCVYFVFVW